MGTLTVMPWAGNRIRSDAVIGAFNANGTNTTMNSSSRVQMPQVPQPQAQVQGLQQPRTTAAR